MKQIFLTVETTVHAPIDLVWKLWNTPDDIIMWNSASDDWHTTKAENNPVTGGHFLSRMEAKDGSFGFDFSGIYDLVEDEKLIEYTMCDNRKAKIIFEPNGEWTKILEIFEAESENPVELQQAGWQAILDNFRNYAEANSKEWPYNY
jgi:uncharacterized protein YndB with AHSA1/START domain